MNRKDAGKGIVLLAAAVASVFLVDRIGSRQQQEESAIVRDAVRRAAVTCYAVEGAYPPDLSYLRENYRLAYNEERFVVSYLAFASNQMPEIRVLERGEGH